MVKTLPVNEGDARDMNLIPGLGRSPGVGNGTPLQYACLENPMDRGAWWATVHRVEKESDMSGGACTIRIFTCNMAEMADFFTLAEITSN